MTTTVPTCPECGSEITNAVGGVCSACGAQVQVMGAAQAKSRGGFWVRQFERVLLVSALVLLAVVVAVLIAIPKIKPLDPAMATSVHPIVAMLRQPSTVFAGTGTVEYANPFILALFLGMTGVVIATIISAQQGRLPFIRRIAGLNAIDEAVGRATEMGRPILFSGGLSGIGIVSLQALAIGAHVGRFAAKYGTRFIVPVCDQTMLPITEQVLRETYASEGKSDSFRPDDIRFLSDRQFAYAAGVTGILHQEKVAATFMFGQFYAESLILAENGQAVGAIQVAGTPDLLQTPFFVVTCDYTIIGDEYYAASAYLSREPTQLGSLSGQDIAKVLLFALVIAGIVWTIFQPENPMLHWMGGGLPQ